MKRKSIFIPVRIISEANNTDHWTKKYKRQKKQEKVVALYLLKETKPDLPVKITLTRIAPRSLDYDNLVFCFKKISDTVSSWLIPGLAPGRADGDKRIEFSYTQRRGKPKEYAIEIEIASLSHN